MIHFAKAHAYGNDFLFVPDDAHGGIEQAALARSMCARHTGIGADGLIYYGVAPDGTVRMRLINADGSASELSGNGLRCLAALVLHERRSGPPVGTVVDVSTDAGWKRLELAGRMDQRYTFRAAMGAPTDIAQETLDVLGQPLVVTTLRVGNPQCVALVDRLPDDDAFHRLGPALSTHPRFAAGTNVEFARVVSGDRVEIRIWERGVGPTHASGTGACASAVAAHAHGGAARDVLVASPGGEQRVEWRDDGIYLTGWAEVVAEGSWLSTAGLPLDPSSR